jgi:hypothetical protein
MASKIKGYLIIIKYIILNFWKYRILRRPIPR